MLILAIDTSGQAGGITLAQADEKSFRLIESTPIAGGTFSAQLIPTFAALLTKHGHSVKDIGGFAAASGPGSFTGLRVGLSAIKGLAETLHKPIAVVSVLEALALMADRTGTIAAALDAGRKEIFFGLYEKSEGVLRQQREELLSQQDFAAALAAEGDVWVITSDAAIAELAAAASVGVLVVTRPGSDMIARIGAGKLLAGETVSVEALDANYLRRSDAEIFFKAAAEMVREKTVRVRPGEAADLSRLVEIASHSATAAQWNQTEYHKLFAPEPVQNGPLQDRSTLVLEQDGDVVGFIVGRQVDNEWEIENIAVTGQARRCGLGTRLLGEFMDLVRGQGGKAIFLEVRESNLAARALYEKWAFVEAGRRKSYYHDPEEDALILRFSFPRQD